VSILLFALLVLVIVALLVWAVRSIPLAPPVGVIAQVVIILGGVIAIAVRAGLV